MTELALASCVGVVAAAGLWLATSRESISVVAGLALLGSAANLFVFAMGRLQQARPPIVPDGATAPLEAVADPLPQALALTAIVIGFAVVSVGLALALALRKRTGEDDVDRVEPADRATAAEREPEYLP